MTDRATPDSERDIAGSDEQYSSPEPPTIVKSNQEKRSIPSKSLYISHFFSTWNSRGFEFGAILFLASIYPGTLLPMSIYALFRAMSAILISPRVGQYIDTRERLQVVRLSIVGQRLAVVLSCLAFLFLLSYKKSSILKHLIFAILILLACVEKLASIMNSVAVERDWVVVIADGQEDALQDMNAQMRRIDLFCKLVSPLIIALLDGWSSKIAIITTLAVNASVVQLEYFLIARVYRRSPALARRRSISTDVELESFSSIESPSSASQTPRDRRSIFSSFREYTRSPAFLPSLSLSILYLTVLSFSGQMTTFLLATSSPKVTSSTIGFLRTISTIFELSSTYIAPLLINHIGQVRAGIWSLSWQLLCLTSGVGLFWTTATTPLTIQVQNSSPLPVTALIISVILSRTGLWSFDLIAQFHIQNATTSSNRGSFSSIEASLQNLFELCAFASTILWSRPDQFRYPALVSLVAVYVAAGLYAGFVRERRGHLLHFPECLKGVTGIKYKVISREEEGGNVELVERIGDAEFNER